MVPFLIENVGVLGDPYLPETKGEISAPIEGSAYTGGFVFLPMRKLVATI